MGMSQEASGERVTRFQILLTFQIRFFVDGFHTDP